jgi:hypothetical protein
MFEVRGLGESCEYNLCAMLRDAIAMDSSLLGEKMIATTRTQRVISRVVRRRNRRFMKAMIKVIGKRKEKGGKAVMCILCRMFAEWGDWG